MWQWAGTHNDVIKWKYFPRYWTFVRGIHRSPVNSPHKGQWRGALMFSLICAWINSWINNREAGDLRHHRAHYDVTVMQKQWKHISNQITWLVPVWLHEFSHDLFWGYLWIYYTHGSWSWILVISTKQRQIWSVRKGDIYLKSGNPSYDISWKELLSDINKTHERQYIIWVHIHIQTKFHW